MFLTEILSAPFQEKYPEPVSIPSSVVALLYLPKILLSITYVEGKGRKQ